MTPKEIANKVAWGLVNTFYRWGGDDPSGFDCSGLVIEILKSSGKLPRSGDWTANKLYYKFAGSSVSTPTDGCLVFWGTDNNITHVEYCIDENHTIGASGGGSSTLTTEDAIKQNAYVKVRPIRDGWVKCVNPFT